MGPAGLRGILIIALAAHGAVAAATFATAWTGSSAMLAAAIQALVGAGSLALLLFGLGRAGQPADAVHPFGYAKELYFWSFVVAILLFSLAAGVVINEGVGKLVDPRPVSVATPHYVVLAAGIALIGLAAAKAFVELKRRRGAAAPLRASRTPVLFTVLLESGAALAGLAIAAAGVLISDLTGRPTADGYAAVAIGLLLGAVAAVMAVEVRSLLVGEAASPETRRDIHEAIVAEVGPGRPIRAVNEIRTLHLGPRSLLVVASVDFDDSRPAAAIEASVARIEETLRSRIPAVRRIFIEGQSARDHADAERIMADRPRGGTRPAAASRRPGAATPAALLSGSDEPAPSEPEKRLSRKERKRQKHLKRR